VCSTVKHQSIEAREQPFKFLSPSSQESMNVAALWNTGTFLDTGWISVAVNHRNLLEEFT
jgi:hypothetical protein